jgi:ketosteroid isomerase-like protein
MSYAVPRAVVEAFYEAYDSRDAQRIAAFVDDNVEWSVYGPVEIMQVCGQWRGKAAVIERWACTAPKVIESSHLDRECLLVDGERSALFGRVTSAHRPTGRVISHRVAHFATWRDDKVATFRVINDSLDAAEQFIGHRIDLSADAAANETDLVIL